MTMAPFTEDEDIIRSCFVQLRKLREEIRIGFDSCPIIDMKYLSMGMSSDFKIALQEGSNMIRIGSALFKG